jgi:hypothetical protein
MDRPTCSTCPFWSQWAGDPSKGDCRHDPPKVFWTHSYNHGNSKASQWPFTSPDEWCGRHPRMKWWTDEAQESYERQYPHTTID